MHTINDHVATTITLNAAKAHADIIAYVEDKNKSVGQARPADGRGLPEAGACADDQVNGKCDNQRRCCPFSFKYLAGSSRRCWTDDGTAQCLQAGVHDAAILEVEV